MDLTRQFMSINQGIVAWSKKEKWGLGYVYSVSLKNERNSLPRLSCYSRTSERRGRIQLRRVDRPQESSQIRLTRLP